MLSADLLIRLLISVHASAVHCLFEYKQQNLTVSAKPRNYEISAKLQDLTVSAGESIRNSKRLV